MPSGEAGRREKGRLVDYPAVQPPGTWKELLQPALKERVSAANCAMYVCHIAAVMSSNGDTQSVLRGVTHGAVDYLIKPVRLEELRNLWQHVVRRKRDLVRNTHCAGVETFERGG